MPATERTRARPAVAISTPCLTRHMVFYFPDRELSQDDREPLDKKWAEKHIREYVSRLLEIAEANFADLRPTKLELLRILDKCMRDRTSFGFSFDPFKFAGMNLRILIVMYQEYFTVTYILDNDVDKLNSMYDTHYVNSVSAFAIDVATQLQQMSIACAAYKYIHNMQYIEAPTYECIDNYYYMNDIIYRKIWVALDFFLGNNNALDIISFVDTLKEDTRGVILTADHTDLEEEDEDRIFFDFQRTKHLTCSRDKKPSIRKYFDAQEDFFRTTLCHDRYVHLMLGEQDAMSWDQNNVLCFVSSKMAIYGSTMCFQQADRLSNNLRSLQKAYRSENQQYMKASDPRIKREHDVRKQKIVSDLNNIVVEKNYDYRRYFVIGDGTSEMSLGRIVRRLHVLSELRCMSFVERHNICTLHDTLRMIGDDLSELIDKMTGSMTKQEPPTLHVGGLDNVIDGYNNIGRGRYLPREAAVSERTECYVSIIDVNSKYAKVPTEYEKTNGGLLYRINRSKHYYDQFISRVNDLRVNRIKGFQPYDRFVERNYFQMYESMKSISERYMALGARVDRAISMSHTLQQRKMAQYALWAATFFSLFSALSALGNGVKIWSTPGYEKIGYAFGGISIVVVIAYIFFIGSKYLNERKIDVKHVVDRNDAAGFAAVLGAWSIVGLVVVYLVMFGYIL